MRYRSLGVWISFRAASYRAAFAKVMYRPKVSSYANSSPDCAFFCGGAPVATKGSFRISFRKLC